MRISILQTDIVWENKQENLRRLREKLETLRGTTEIVVLPVSPPALVWTPPARPNPQREKP